MSSVGSVYYIVATGDVESYVPRVVCGPYCRGTWKAFIDSLLPTVAMAAVKRNAALDQGMSCDDCLEEPSEYDIDSEELIKALMCELYKYGYKEVKLEEAYYEYGGMVRRDGKRLRKRTYSSYPAEVHKILEDEYRGRVRVWKKAKAQRAVLDAKYAAIDAKYGVVGK
jgi:hypothetical protein